MISNYYKTRWYFTKYTFKNEFYLGSGYPSLSLPSPYETILSYSGSGYPTYQQSYSCLTPYPPTTFSAMSPYQVGCLHNRSTC